MTSKPIPLSLRKKTSARIAAVQCLYQRKLTGESLLPEKMLENYIEHWQDDHKGEERVFSKDPEPDKSLLRKILITAVEHQDRIDSIIRASLTDKWKVERMSPLMLAILASALVELKFLSTLSAAIIIDEYVTLTGRFFEGAEVGFVNGILDHLAATQVSLTGE